MNRYAVLVVASLILAVLVGCDDDPPPECEGDSCPEECEESCSLDETRCSEDSDSIEICQENAADCLDWSHRESCGENQICEMNGDVASCVCDDECDDAGESICEDNSIEECLEDGDGCLYVGTTDCGTSTCVEDNGDATCEGEGEGEHQFSVDPENMLEALYGTQWFTVSSRFNPIGFDDVGDLISVRVELDYSGADFLDFGSASSLDNPVYPQENSEDFAVVSEGPPVASYTFTSDNATRLSSTQRVAFTCRRTGEGDVLLTAEWSFEGAVLDAAQTSFNAICTEDTESELPLEFDWTTDPLDDFIISIFGFDPTFTPIHIDIINFASRLDEMTMDAMNRVFNWSVVECGTTTELGTVVCPSGVQDMPEGELLSVAMQLAEEVPLDDSGHSYIYSLVLDSDGDPANDWVYHDPYDWDLFQDADRWYQLTWDHRSSEWSLDVTQVSASQTTSTVPSTVRALIRGDTIIYYVSMSELSPDASYRVCSFAHDGTYDFDDAGADVNGADPTEPLTEI